MHLLSHSIYEIRKGVRKLAMVTLRKEHLALAEARLLRTGISYTVLQTTGSQANIMLGATECIALLRSFGEENLSRFSPEQDFILGALLGYDLSQQCQRYMAKTSAAELVA